MNKLLSLNSYHYRRGGSDVVYFEHERMFSDLGWATAHMSMRHPKNEPSSWERFFVDEIEFGHKYGLLQKLSMAGKVVYSREAQQKLRSLLDVFDADIAHVHCIYHHLSPSVLPVLRERGVPVVVTAHDLKLACPAYKMLNSQGICEKCRGGNLLHVIANRCVRESTAVSAIVAVESMLAKGLGLWRKNVDKVVAPSRFYLEKLVEWGWPRQQLTYIPNYVQAERFTPHFPAGEYFLYFGRLAPEKGVGTLIDAARACGVSLKIVGTGPSESDLKQRATGARVDFLGYQAGDHLWDIVKHSRAVVLPSEWYENAPMSVLEAYALGKPVLGAQIGGIPELIKPELTGLLFRSGDVTHLAEQLGRMQGLPDAALSDMGQRGRELVTTSYNSARYLESMLSLYRSLS